MSLAQNKGPQPKEETKEPNSPQKQISSPGFEVFVKSLPFATSSEAVEKFFSDCGKIEAVNLLRDRIGRLKGTGFIRFSTKEAAQKALTKDGKEFEGRTLGVDLAKPKEERSPGPRGGPRGGPRQGSQASNSIFIGNLNYTTTEDELRSFFKDCGSVKAVRLATDADGSSKGFAHIDFENKEDAELAVQKSGSELDGRTLRVDFANSGRKFGGNREGGFGGFRGGSRGGFRGSRGGYRGGYSGGSQSRGSTRGGFGGSRGGYRSEGGFREGGFREGGNREGGYREGGNREGGYREGGNKF